MSIRIKYIMIHKKKQNMNSLYILYMYMSTYQVKNKKITLSEYREASNLFYVPLRQINWQKFNLTHSRTPFINAGFKY